MILIIATNFPTMERRSRPNVKPQLKEPFETRTQGFPKGYVSINFPQNRRLTN